MSNPDKLADKMLSAGLITEATKQSVTQSQGIGVTPLTRAAVLVDDFRRVLKGDKDKEEKFVRFCELLKECLAPAQQTLVEEMLQKIGNG